jgi:CsoR family transcriptional regulator, copper-sensing transcriptional repressor
MSNEKIHVHHDQKQKKILCDRLVRIEGQIRGIKKMVESGVYCEDILNQMAAAKSALNGVIVLLFEDHAQHCISLPSTNAKDAPVQELTRLVKRLIG